MVCDPTPVIMNLHNAVPPLVMATAVPAWQVIGEPLLVKLTVPVGVGVPLSVAVMVIDVPVAAGFLLDVRVKDVGDAVPSSVCVNAAADFGA